MILLVATSGIAQSFACGFNRDYEGKGIDGICNHFSFKSNQEAVKVIDKILDQVGLIRNFVVVECPNIENAIATNVPDGKGQRRYIIYDNEFLERLSSRGLTDWVAVGILAHEVGHHLNAHTLLSRGSYPKIELEADEFAGWILFKLGANQAQTKAMFKTFPLTTSDTHPGRYERENAAIKGWLRAKALSTQEPEPEFDYKEFVHNYYGIMESENYQELKEFYRPRVERFFGNWDLSVDEIILDAQNYDTRFGVYSKEFHLDWTKFQVDRIGENVRIVYELDYYLDRKEKYKKSYFRLKMSMLLDSNNNIFQIYEEQLE